MDTMTHKQRFLGALNRKPVDLLPCGDGLWGETAAKYVAQGKLKEGEDHCAHFDMSCCQNWAMAHARACGNGVMDDAYCRHNGGSNIAFADGHVKWKRQQTIIQEACINVQCY